jgi:predicted DNA-binding antitoxin AbrB/MazE fold protein
MNKAVEAIYDGKVFKPTEPIKIKANTRVLITVKPAPSNQKKASFLKTALSLKLEGPADWSVNLENYLYGDRKNEA